MNPALDKYYESLIQMKGGKKKKASKRSGKKKNSGKKKKASKRSGKKKRSTKRKSSNKYQPRIVDHTIGRNRLDQILGGIPILSSVNPLLTSFDTYNPVVSVPTYNDIPTYNPTVAAANAPVAMAATPPPAFVPSPGGIPSGDAFLNPPDSSMGAMEHPAMGAYGHPTMGTIENSVMGTPMMGHNSNDFSYINN
jgi:hypothetical protein